MLHRSVFSASGDCYNLQGISKAENSKNRLWCFYIWPIKAADIEQSLVIGAQGPISNIIILI